MIHLPLSHASLTQSSSRTSFQSRPTFPKKKARSCQHPVSFWTKMRDLSFFVSAPNVHPLSHQHGRRRMHIRGGRSRTCARRLPLLLFYSNSNSDCCDQGRDLDKWVWGKLALENDKKRKVGKLTVFFVSFECVWRGVGT